MVHPQHLHEAMRTAEVAGQQATWLSPLKKIAASALVMVLGTGLLFDERGRALPHVAWVLLVGGAGALLVSLRGLFAERQRRHQLAELEARWPELEAGMQAAIAAGQSPVRYLQAAGIASFEVRQSALRRLRGEAERAAPRRDVAAEGPSAAYVPRGARPGPPEPPAPHWIPRG